MKLGWFEIISKVYEVGWRMWIKLVKVWNYVNKFDKFIILLIF